MKLEFKNDHGWYEVGTSRFYGETLKDAASVALDSSGSYVGFYDCDVKLVALLEVFRRWSDEVNAQAFLGGRRDPNSAQRNKDRRLKHLGMVDENSEENELFYFACTVLDHKGLIDWGSSVRGSWPTDEGRAFLETFGGLLREGVDVI